MKSVKYSWVVAIVTLGCVLAGGCFFNPNYYEAKAKGIIVSLRVHAGELDAEGDWKWRSYQEGRQGDGRPVLVMFDAFDEGDHRRFSYSSTIKDLNWDPELRDGEKSDERIRFSLTWPSGQWVFSGERQRRGASGVVRFQPNPAYINEVNMLCGGRVSVGELIRLGSINASIDGLRRYKSSVSSLTVQEWIQLLNYGITPELAESMNGALGPDASVRSLIECHNYGIDPSFISGYSRAGYAFSYKELIQLSNYGVSVDFATDIMQGGMNLDAAELIQLHNYGIQPSYAVRLKDLGYDNMKDIIDLHNYGVSEQFIAAIKDSGYNPSLRDIIQLRNYGVSADFLQSTRKMGYAFSVDQVIALRNSGVTETYLADLMQAGHKPLSARTIIDMYTRGVPAESVRAVRSQ